MMNEEHIVQDEKMKINEVMRKSKKRSLIAFCLAGALLLSSTTAYFTDRIHTTQTGAVGTVDISFDSDVNLLNPDGKDILNPGDIRNISFSIENEGNKSVDTEIRVTLTASKPMSNNRLEYGGKSISPFAAGGSAMEDPNAPASLLYSQRVYSSEYELYWADDVLAVEGYGHYPRGLAYPAETRYMNAAQTQIVYALDGGVLSGNSEEGEREIEYERIIEPVLNPYVLSEYEHAITRGDLSSIIPGATDVYFSEVGISYDLNAETVVIPEYFVESNGDKSYAEYVVFYWDDSQGVGIPGVLKDIYVGSNVKGFVMFDVDYQEITAHTKEAFENRFDVNVNYYEDLDYLVSTSNLPENLSEVEYMQLDDTLKSFYEKCEDGKIYDLVLLFDPYADNAFQNSNVSLKIEVRAKQHRNAEAGWELVATDTNAIIRDTIFTVEYDSMHRVQLTGLKDGYSLDSLTNVSIPEGVEIVSAGFFDGCENLESVNLPSTLLEIQNSAFRNCTSLTTVNLPDGLQCIGESAFEGCESLNDIDIPDSVLIIKDYAFNGCSSLTSIVIPGSVNFNSWGHAAFMNSGLESVEFADGCEYLQACMFEECTSLTNIKLSNNVEIIPYRAFYGCTSLESIELPEALMEIEQEAFDGCSNLSSIAFPEAVNEIYRSAFANCTNLEYVDFGSGVWGLYDYAFENCPKLIEITIPNQIRHISQNVFFVEGDAVETVVRSNNYVAKNYDWAANNRIATILPIE